MFKYLDRVSKPGYKPTFKDKVIVNLMSFFFIFMFSTGCIVWMMTAVYWSLVFFGIDPHSKVFEW